MASFTKQIPAGGEGKISIAVKTSGYGGRKMAKTSHVLTDDPVHPKKQLIVTGFVERFVTISPRGMVRMIGYLGNDIKKNITIIPEKNYPFEIKNITAKSGKDFTFNLSEKQPDTKGYVITLENKKAEKGRYYDTLFIETTSKVKPIFTIRVFGDIREKKTNS